MDVMNLCRIFVTGNAKEGYAVTFSDYILNKRLAFKVANHGWIVAHLEWLQREGQLQDYALFDTSDNGANHE